MAECLVAKTLAAMVQQQHRTLRTDKLSSFMKKLFIILLCFPMLTGSLWAQTGNSETDALLDSARNYIYSDKIKSYKFAAELKEKALKINDKTALAYAYHVLGIIDESHGDNEVALKNYTTALNYADLSGDKVARLRILIALSNYYVHLSQTEKCIEICHQGIKEAMTIGNNEIASQFYNNLSLAHSYINEYDKALIYSDKSIELKKGLKDEESLANAYLNRGLILTNKGDYENGFKHYALAEELYLKNNTYHALTQTQINYAWDYTDLKQFRQARTHLSKALFFAEKSDDKIRQAAAWNAFGYYYNNVGYTDSVTYALEKGLQISLESENKRNALVAYKELSNHYQKTGNTKLAFDNLNKAYTLKDSIFDELKIQLAQSLNARYETEQKEQQIELLTAQKQKQQLTILFIILSAVLLGIISFLLFVRFKKKQKRKSEQALQAQKEAERIRIASDMHDEIGAGLTRIVMRSEQVKAQLQSGKELKNGIVESLDKMATESRELSHNIGEIIWALNPRNDTLDNLFAYIRNYVYDYLDEANIACEIAFPENIPTTFVSPELRRNVFLIVKESLNNLAKHAKATQVDVILLISENHFSLAIKDNGIGIADMTQTSGNGLGNMKKRTEAIGGDFIVKSDNGLCLSIENIPFKNQTKVG